MQVDRLQFETSEARYYEPGAEITSFCPVYVRPVPAGTYLETVNPPARAALWPPGLVTTTFQVPVAAVMGRPNRQVIVVGEATTTFVAGILSAEPVLASFTVAPAWKPLPTSFVTATVDPCIPVFGVTETTENGDWTVIMPVLVSVPDWPAALPTLRETV